MDDDQKKFEDLEDLDFDLIDNHPWAQDMWTYLSEGFKKGFLNWCKYVLNLTEDAANVDHWSSVYRKEFEDFVCEFVVDMASLNDKVITQAEELLVQLQELCKTLRIEMPNLGDKKLGLFEEVKLLEKKIAEYEMRIEARQAEINQLLDRQKEVCRSLGKPGRYLPKNPLPTAEQIEELQKFIDSLESQKYEREEKFLEAKSEILAMAADLNFTPLCEFENNVLSGSDSTFLVTDLNMKELEKLQKKLVLRKQEMKEEISEKWAKIEGLWSVLEIDVGERGYFVDSTKGSSHEVLEKLKQELKRLESIKRENIKVFIEKYRTELLALWDSCHISQHQRNFDYFHADCYTEDFLELFELEIARWKKYYEENKHLIKLIEEYNRCWRKVAELDEKANGPDRFKNRGGKLLQEEKERNRLGKKVPLIEEELRNLCAKYEEKTGETFLTWGKTIDEMIEELYRERENERKVKLSARKMQREKSMLTPGESATHLFPGTSTTNLRQTPEVSKTKRKLLSTPRTEIKKKPRMLESKLIMSESRKRKVVTGTVASIKKRKSMEASIKERRRSATKSKSKDKENIDSSGYEHFEMEMTNRSSNHRSTLHNELLALPLATSKTPKKTPVKPKIPKLLITAPTPFAGNGIGTPKNTRLATKPPSTPKSPRTFGVLSAARSNFKLNF